MTVSGMTGFARESGAAGAWTWAVEARSVNGRNLEVRFRAPTGFEGVERAARDGAQARFQRGQVHIGVQARRLDAGTKAQVDLDAFERLLALSKPYVASGAVTAPSFDGLLALRGVMVEAEEGDDPEAREALEAAVAATVMEALDGLKAARQEEGRALDPVLQGFIDQIEALVATAAGLAVSQPEALKERFAKKIADLAGSATELQERIVQEAALLAVKADVREELDRLTAHIASARGLLSANAASGRRLDFLSQEFMREANTLCSKSAATALTAAGLELKAVIEQFREQVQNVE